MLIRRLAWMNQQSLEAAVASVSASWCWRGPAPTAASAGTAYTEFARAAVVLGADYLMAGLANGRPHPRRRQWSKQAVDAWLPADVARESQWLVGYDRHESSDLIGFCTSILPEKLAHVLGHKKREDRAGPVPRSSLECPV